MSIYTVVVGDYPHTKPIKEGKYSVEGCQVQFEEYEPVYKAFAPMVRELKFDICEMAIVTFLQAREAGKAISLLPVVMSGNFHHRSLTRWSGAPNIEPGQLAGRRIGVRSYTQTTGLWVRGALAEDYGVNADEITWVTTEGPHVLEYEEPDNVERSAKSLIDLARDGDVAAVISEPIAVKGGTGSLVPVIEDWHRAEQAWRARHQAIPINHMLTVRTSVIERDPAAARGIYEAFRAAIDAVGTDTADVARARAIDYGRSEEIGSTLDTAVSYALAQRLIAKPVTVDELLADFERHVDV